MTPPTHALATPAISPMPRLTADQIRSHQRGTAQAPATSRVLVLDATDERHDLLVDVVTRAGGESLSAATGADAIEQLRDEEVHLVLVAGLPDGTPRGFVSWARPRYPDVAIVAVASDAADATDLYNAGADVVTTLPVDPDLLGAELAAALRRVRRHHLRLV